MRSIIAALVTVAVVALAACSSNTSSVAAPSLVTPGAGPAAPNVACPAPNCVFTATPFSGGASTWTGTTTAKTAPWTGHHGSLEVVFAAPFMFGGSSTLSWRRFATGNKADCTITNDVDSAVVKLASCEDGSYVVHPTVTTVYTFTDTKNDPPSQDPVQTASVTVVVPTTVNITAKWQSGMGAGDDDPLIVYEGTASGVFTHLDVNATSHTHCGLSGNRENPASTFHASMSFVDPMHATGSYDGVACTVDVGTFALTKQ